MISNQANLFLIFVLNGVIIGLVFDFFRIIRKSFKTSDIITIIQDIIFWIITGIIILYSIFIFNNGEIRFFMFIGILIGVLLYIVSLSKYIINISVKIINVLKKLIKIIILPIKTIYLIIKKLIKKPILFCCINIKKIFIQLITKKCKNKKKKIGENNTKSRIIN